MRLIPAACVALLPPLLLLAGCGDDAAPEDEARAASGEVLEGTISDSMLPLATVRSQPPLLPPDAQDGDDEADRASSRSNPATATTAEPAADAPVPAEPPEVPAENRIAE